MRDVTKWELAVYKAWLTRNDSDDARRHPPRADRIYRRYAEQIERAEAWVKQQRPKNWWEK